MPVVNRGSMVALGTSDVDGPLTNDVGSSLLVESRSTLEGAAVFTVAQDLTNRGTIEMNWAGFSSSGPNGPCLEVGDGTLINEPQGTILRTSRGSQAHTINAQVENRGTIAVLGPSIQ